tara:strand:- start:7769 stop:8617 length:849 start_codon:yes stop_codon:yes gene_type:complete
MTIIQKINILVQKVAFRLYLFLDSFINAQWYSFPYGKIPHATIEEYEELARSAKANTSKVVTDYEQRIGFSINTDWLDNLALHTQIVKKKSDLSYIHGRIIYTTLMQYLKNDKGSRINIIETGTARGFSALCMAKALDDSNVKGLITTFDILPHHQKMIWNCIDDHSGAKSRSELLSPWQNLVDKFILFHQGYSKVELPKVQLDRVHFAFLDGAHGYDDVISEFNQIKDKQELGDIIIYDDYNKVQFPGLVKAVDEICSEHSYKRIDITPDSERAYVVAVKE